MNEQEWDAGESAYLKAQKILEWEDNWDGDGAVAYKRETLERAYRIVVPTLKKIHEIYEYLDVCLPLPQFQPGPDGGIDVMFEGCGRELLLYVPANPNEQANYYGDTDAGSKVTGYVEEPGLKGWAHALVYLFERAA